MKHIGKYCNIRAVDERPVLDFLFEGPWASVFERFFRLCFTVSIGNGFLVGILRLGA